MGKYGNRKAIVDGIPFDSKAEAARYRELKLLEKAGEIWNLQLQPKFELIPKQPGERAVTYTADFRYTEKVKYPGWKWSGDTREVVEDVKSPATAKDKAYIIKRKLFKQLYPDIVFREV